MQLPNIVFISETRCTTVRRVDFLKETTHGGSAGCEGGDRNQGIPP